MKDVKDHGIGVGLACSKFICEYIMGEIYIDEVYTGGTSVVVLIPVCVAKSCISFI